jgi:hypothetical protein
MDAALLQTFLRYSFLFLFGFLSTKGFYDASLIEPLVGAALGLFAIIWFVITKNKKTDIKEDVDNNT